MTENKIVAGALFDFLRFLTTRDGTLKTGCMHECTPALDALTEFAEARGLSLEEADVNDWGRAS